MKAILRKEILMETYKDMQKLIFAIAWKFWKIHGGDIGDLIGQANLIFIDAFDSYNPNEGTELTTWVAFKIKKGLLDYMRKEIKDNPYTRTDEVFASYNMKYVASLNKNFSVMELVDEMGQDARIVLQLFLDTPKDIMVNIRNSHQRIDHVQAAMRNRLRNRLRQMGWTMKRTKKAFEEIKNVVSY